MNNATENANVQYTMNPTIGDIIERARNYLKEIDSKDLPAGVDHGRLKSMLEDVLEGLRGSTSLKSDQKTQESIMRAASMLWVRI